MSVASVFFYMKKNVTFPRNILSPFAAENAFTPSICPNRGVGEKETGRRTDQSGSPKTNGLFDIEQRAVLENIGVVEQ